MKNKVLDNTQKMLDKLKWLESEKEKKDKSGAMPYCDYCFYKDLDGFCYAEQKNREACYHCAKAYKRMLRGKKNV